MSNNVKNKGFLFSYIVLVFFSIIALFPIYMIIANSFKLKTFVFSTPFSFPNAESFSLIGYKTVFEMSNLAVNFVHSITVTVLSLLLIIFLGAAASFALAKYKFKFNIFIKLFLTFGIMIPIRLGTVGILKIMSNLNLVNTQLALILIYVAQGLPMAVFILTGFIQQMPEELLQAARIDGAGEYRIFILLLPLIKPALGALGIFTMIPIWNDLWFPLIIAPSAKTATLTLGVQQFLGQFLSNWNAVLSALSLAMIPIIIIYLIFSKQMIKSVTAGALKA